MDVQGIAAPAPAHTPDRHTPPTHPAHPAHPHHPARAQKAPAHPKPAAPAHPHVSHHQHHKTPAAKQSAPRESVSLDAGVDVLGLMAVRYSTQAPNVPHQRPGNGVGAPTPAGHHRPGNSVGSPTPVGGSTPPAKPGNNIGSPAPVGHQRPTNSIGSPMPAKPKQSAPRGVRELEQLPAWAWDVALRYSRRVQ